MSDSEALSLIDSVRQLVRCVRELNARVDQIESRLNRIEKTVELEVVIDFNATRILG